MIARAGRSTAVYSLLDKQCVISVWFSLQSTVLAGCSPCSRSATTIEYYGIDCGLLRVGSQASRSITFVH